MYRSQHRHQSCRQTHADHPTTQGEKQSFQKKMKQNAAIGGAQSLPQSNLMRPFADCDQHDIDDTDGAQRQRDHSHRSQKHVHDVENGSHHF